MEENRYYTPEEEEFHVGFEFEYNRNDVWYEYVEFWKEIKIEKKNGKI